MPLSILEPDLFLGVDSAGMLLTPQEFDDVQNFDEEFRYELIHGVLVVNPIPLPEETAPNDVLGFFLRLYQHSHPQGSCLDDTLPQQYVRTFSGRRLADRLIWTGLGGRVANPRSDVPTIAVEFVSAGKRNRKRDYEDKRQEYGEAGLKEYWIVDRFQRTLTVIRYTEDGNSEEFTFSQDQTYESPLLPGFVFPLIRILEAAQR